MSGMRAFEIDLEPSSVTHSALPSNCYACYLRHHHHQQQHHHRRHFPARHNHYHHNHNHHHHNHHDFVFTSNFRHISKLPCFFLLILTFSIIGPFSLSLSMTMFYDLQLLNVRLTKPDNSDEEQRCSKLLLLSQINSNKMKTSSYPV